MDRELLEKTMRELRGKQSRRIFALNEFGIKPVRPCSKKCLDKQFLRGVDEAYKETLELLHWHRSSDLVSLLEKVRTKAKMMKSLLQPDDIEKVCINAWILEGFKVFAEELEKEASKHSLRISSETGKEALGFLKAYLAKQRDLAKTSGFRAMEEVSQESHEDCVKAGVKAAAIELRELYASPEKRSAEMIRLVNQAEEHLMTRRLNEHGDDLMFFDPFGRFAQGVYYFTKDFEKRLKNECYIEGDIEWLK